MNTILDFTIYTTLTRGWSFWRSHYLLANALSFTIVVTWSFVWNKRWTFRDRSPCHGRQYVTFVGVTIGGLGLAEGALAVGVHWFRLPDLLAKVTAGPLVVVWNFLAYRFLAFPNTRTVPPPRISAYS